MNDYTADAVANDGSTLSHKQRAHARGSNVLHDGDPETSYEAADSISSDTINEVQQRVLDIVTTLTVATDDQIIKRYRRDFPKDRTTDQSIRSRRAELVKKKGLLRHSGEYGNSPTGARRARLWELNQ